VDEYEYRIGGGGDQRKTIPNGEDVLAFCSIKNGISGIGGHATTGET